MHYSLRPIYLEAIAAQPLVRFGAQPEAVQLLKELQLEAESCHRVHSLRPFIY